MKIKNELIQKGIDENLLNSFIYEIQQKEAMKIKERFNLIGLDVGKKACRTCGIKKNIDEFSKDKGKPRPDCKICFNEKRKSKKNN